MLARSVLLGFVVALVVPLLLKAYITYLFWVLL